MAISPTSLIATHGLINGQGLQVNPQMLDHIDAFTSSPLLTSFSGLSTNPNVGNVAGLTDTLASLPSFFTDGPSIADMVTSHASNLLPGGIGGISSFLGLHNTAAGFVASSTDFSAALNSFAGDGGGGGGFGDFGVGITSALSSISGGAMDMLGGFDLSSVTDSLGGSLSGIIDQAQSLAGDLSSGLNDLVSQAQSLVDTASGSLNSALGDLSSGVLSATDALGNAGASIIQTSIKEIGSSLPNFGSAFDFTDLASLGPTNLVSTLQSQGLGDISGLNTALTNLNLDPAKLTGVAESTLTSALSQVQGASLDKILSATGVNLQNPIGDLSGMLDVKNLMSPTAIASMGLPADLAGGLAGLGNKLTNMGVQADNLSIGKYLSTIEVGNFPHLNALTSVVPADIASGINSAISAGNGSGVFGNPTLVDVMGTAAGVTHIETFNTIKTLTDSMASHPIGQAITTGMTQINNLLSLGYDGASAEVTAAAANLTSSVDQFNSKFAGQSHLISQNLVYSQDQVNKELQNINLAGLDLNAVPPAGTQDILGFGQSLHDYGVDYQNMGYNTILTNCATNDLTGDAIKASLMEGRNLVRASLVNIPTPTVPDTGTIMASATPVVTDPNSIVWNKTDLTSMTDASNTIRRAMTQVQTYTQNPGNLPDTVSQVKSIEEQLSALRTRLNAEQLAYFQTNT